MINSVDLTKIPQFICSMHLPYRNFNYPGKKLLTTFLRLEKAFLTNACESRRLLQLAKQPNYRTKQTLQYSQHINTRKLSLNRVACRS